MKKKKIFLLISLGGLILASSISMTFAAVDTNPVEPQGIKVDYVTQKVYDFISSKYYLNIKSKLSIDDVSGYLYDVPSIQVSSRGNLPSRYTTPNVYRFVKQRSSSYTVHIDAELYTVDTFDNNMNISDIVSYSVSSTGPL
ncbi:hypothetical protein B5E48_13020 [Massilimicrobiota sp. An105]|uniref:hypothetical protein n=1 Tax=Massilimicrobiota sp. An105 TaxID=1965540 RepID=UPI000B36A77E|nr:hypothetical protein [Massilimicrobiota sp. An105]OUQ74276.1 hypothetical protein B5E48_13020 [Massilimicrobiota sp. An105]